MGGASSAASVGSASITVASAVGLMALLGAGSVPAGPPIVVVTTVPAHSGVRPTSMNSSSAVPLIVSTACSGFSMPGSSTMMRRSPCACTIGSVSPRLLTRFSTMRRAVSIEFASSSCPAGTSAANNTWRPPCRSSPRRSAMSRCSSGCQKARFLAQTGCSMFRAANSATRATSMMTINCQVSEFFILFLSGIVLRA